MVAGSCTSLTALFQELLENGASPYHVSSSGLDVYCCILLCEIMHADFSLVEGLEVSSERRKKKGMFDVDIFRFYETEVMP